MIGIFTDCFPPLLDGVSITAQNYANWLSKKGHEICVVTPNFPNLPTDTTYPIYTYASAPIPMRKPYRLGIPQVDYAFKKTLKHLDFELVHTHNPFSSGHLAMKSAKKKGIPIIATFHSKFRQDFERVVPSKKLVDMAVKRIASFYDQADEVWIPQASVEETLREYGYKGEVVVVDNGNDFTTSVERINELRTSMRKKLKLGDNEIMLLFVGQHIWEKNIGFMLDSIALLKDSPFHLFMIGIGYAAKKIKDKIQDLGLADKVTMVGSVEDRELLKGYYAAADLFLFPSLYDNAPLVVREAAAMHTPSVMLEGSTCADIIANENNGFLTMMDTHAYATIVKRLMEHPNLLKRVGINASKTIARPWEDVIDEVYLRYQDLIRRHNMKFLS